jgi:hypothetical protein
VAEKTFDARDGRNLKLLTAARIQHDNDVEAAIAKTKRDANNTRLNALELRWREQYGPRARSYRDDIHRLVKDLAEKRSTKEESYFSVYSNWLRERFADQWETFEVTTDIADFGSVKWKGRQLDAIIVKSIIQQKNRIIGAYSRDCFVFGLIDDAEFAMQREVYSAACGSGDKVDQVDQVVREWKVGNEFQSLWNAERTGEIQSKTRVGDLKSAQPNIQD